MPLGNTTAMSAYDPFRWLKRGGLVLLAVTILSTVIYWSLGQYYARPDWTPLHCLFMVVITLTTIGYGDWLDIRNAPLAEIYTMILAVVGMGVPAFVITNAIGLIVEGLFSDIYRRRKMDKQIAGMKEHFILCGVGTTGLHCAIELLRTRRSFVAIDKDVEQLERLRKECGEFPYVVGAAGDDDVLRAAGIERAQGLLACLTEDKDNLFITITARALNPKLRIISRVVDEEARPKLLRAGANSVVNTTAIGGMRVVSEMVRPTVVTFLDAMLRDPDDPHRFEELTVEPGSDVENRTLATAELRRNNKVLVVSVKLAGERQFTYSPSADLVLKAGCTLVLLASVSDLEELRPRFRAKT